MVSVSQWVQVVLACNEDDAFARLAADLPVMYSIFDTLSIIVEPHPRSTVSPDPLFSFATSFLDVTVTTNGQGCCIEPKNVQIIHTRTESDM